MVDQKQRRHLPLQYPNLPQEIIVSRKKLENQEHKEDPALNPPQESSTMMKPLGALSIFKAFARVDIWRNTYFTWLDFVVTKSQEKAATKLSPEA